MAPDGKYLYLGGSLLSGLSTLMFLGFLNIFFRSQLLFQVREISDSIFNIFNYLLWLIDWLMRINLDATNT